MLPLFYKHFTACCEELGFDYRAIANYATKHNISKEESLDLHLTEFCFEGVKYAGVKACCDNFGLPYRNVCSYKRITKVSDEEAIKHYLSKNKDFQDSNNNNSPSVKENTSINHSNMHGVNNRQLRILEILKKCKFVTTEDLSVKLGVTTRTLRFDIAYLKKIHPNIVTRRGNSGGIEWKD